MNGVVTALETEKGVLGTMIYDQSLDSTTVLRILNDGNFYARVNSLIQDLNVLVIDMKEHPGQYVHVSIF